MTVRLKERELLFTDWLQPAFVSYPSVPQLEIEYNTAISCHPGIGSMLVNLCVRAWLSFKALCLVQSLAVFD